jgi:anti-sigma-K factor RskA
VAHLSADRLAALATDPTVEPEPSEVEHLSRCRACHDDVTELGALAHDVREVQPSTLRAPHPDVWAAISQEVQPAAPVGWRRRWLPVAVAAAAGLVVGIAGTLGVQALGPDGGDGGGPGGGTSVVASVDLSALPGESGEGTAELVRAQDSLMLRVHAALQPSPTDDYHEVWLINADGRRMYSLGVLPSSGDADYWLPTPLDGRLDGYSTVDISLEPDDGDTAHSRHSLVRGTLPG